MNNFRIEIIATCENEENGINTILYYSTNEPINMGMINRKIKAMYNGMSNFTIIVEPIHESRNL
jgi:hypothetical protein